MFKRELLSQIRYLTITTVLLGISSFVFSAVVSRQTTPEIAARVFTMWTISNFLLLVFQYPIEIYGPKLHQTNGNSNDLRKWINRFCTFSGLLVATIAMGTYRVIYGEWRLEAISFVLLIFAMSQFFSRRAYFVAKGELQKFTQLISIFAASTTFSLLGARFIGITNANQIIGIVVFGYCISLAVERLLDLRNHQDIALEKQVSSVNLPIGWLDHGKEMISLSTSSLISILLISGGSFFTGYVKLSEGEVVVYIGTISIVMIPLSILNSSGMAIHLRGIKLVEQKDKKRFFKLFYTAVFGYLVGVLAVSGVMFVSGERIMQLYLGGKYTFDRAELVLISITIGFAIITALPRMLMTSLGRTSKLLMPSLFTIAMYFLVLLTYRKHIETLCLASILGSASIFLLSTQSLFKHAKFTETTS
jgi:O-antigen/teichoic acid export membrane protein